MAVKNILLYLGWQTVYENDLYKILENHGATLSPELKAQVLGGEVALWTEQVKQFFRQLSEPVPALPV
jgi:hypothetical protein